MRRWLYNLRQRLCRHDWQVAGSLAPGWIDEECPRCHRYRSLWVNLDV